MGEWLSRVLERGKTSNKKLKGCLESITDKTDRMPEPIVAHVNVSSSMPYLTDGEREALQEYIEVMTSPQFNLPRDRAEREAFELVTRNRRELQARQAARDYKLDGYIKIYSTVLGQDIYLARDERVAKRVLDQSLPVCTEAELKSLRGMKMDEVKALMEGKMVFGGSIITKTVSLMKEDIEDLQDEEEYPLGEPLEDEELESLLYRYVDKFGFYPSNWVAQEKREEALEASPPAPNKQEDESHGT